MQTVLSISERAKLAPASPIRKLVPFADEAEKAGKKVYRLNIGDPDFDIPEKIQETLLELASDLKRIPYTNSQGLSVTLEAWRTYYQQVGISLNTEDMLITTGGSEALILISALLFDPGDEFIVFEPFYTNYHSFGNLVSAKIVPVALDAKTGFHLPSDDEILSRLTSRTKAIFFTNPNNPTGTVFTEEEVKRLIAFAKKHNLFLVSDETYRGMCFDNRKMVSVLAVATEEEKQHIIVIDSVSKRLNACGARIGIMISKNREIMEGALRFAQGRLSVAYLEQAMIAPMLSDSLDYLTWLTAKYEKRRDVFIAKLETELGITMHKPEGAFYTMIPLPVDDAEKFATFLLTDFSDNNETVMVAPGAGFYATPGKGTNEVRVAYVLNEKNLERAAELLTKGVKAYLSTTSS